MNAPRPTFNLFVSYAHEDNQGVHAGKVTALVEAIRARHAEAFPNDPLKDFFDVADIVSGDYWKEKILAGLEQSAVMIAVLSPAYFRSNWCRREWETFTQLELQRTYPGEAISPIYVLRHPDFDADESQLLDAWLKDLKNRQYVEWLPYFPHGAAALEQREVRARLNDLHDQAWERVKKVRLFRRQPWNVPTEKNQIFVGREGDLQRLNERLMTRQTVGVTAVSGFGGIGKTTLAFRYAQRFRDHYPGGVLYLSCETLTKPEELRSLLLGLAPHFFLRPDMSDTERSTADQRLADIEQGRQQGDERIYQQFKAHLEAGDRKLLIFDNVSDLAVLNPAARKLLPSPQNVRLLFTTRLGAVDLGGLDTVTLGLVSAADALELLFRWRRFARDTNSSEYQRACRDEVTINEDALTSNDAEWKAALAIVNRVERLTLAVEVIGVHLSLHQEISFKAFLDGMKRKGIGAKLNDAGRDAKVRQWIAHPETLMGPLFEPTLAKLSPLALRTLEYAAFLHKDQISIAWLRSLVHKDPDTRPLLSHDPDDANPWLDALRLLADRQLLHNIQESDNRALGHMHPILREVLVARQKDGGAVLRNRIEAHRGTGIVKTKTDKGFGFIAVEGSGDVFFHSSACGGQFDNLQVGQAVTFELEHGPKGPRANSVMAA